MVTHDKDMKNATTTSDGERAMTTGIEINEETLQKYIFGELTWAEIVGFTAEEAHVAADYGLACIDAGRLDEATTVFEGLLAFNPRDAFAHVARGTIAERQGDDTLAFAHYSAALELEPTMVPALLARAELLLKLGEVELAREDIAAAEAQKPEGEDAARLASLKSRTSEKH